ncbi:MAG: hypothetical protein HWQ38_18695 [Nostoc sp. NMS7]|uniref:hypothetical protein n=1 Tax=Nostoc sp. NMS7 TaxID=2815391 RepID=UPI0025D1EBCC|nr:hypothetical protein [Nostoc sp. NMS7]MBN3948366.1 hypothetical protein [Nostoc sp. NMS7]
MSLKFGNSSCPGEVFDRLRARPIFESSDNSQSVACRRRDHSSFKRGCIAIALPILGGNYLEKNPCCI